MTAGASASVYGVLGLFVSALVGGWFHPSPLTVPAAAIARLAPAAVLVLRSVLTGGAETSAQLVGQVIGLLFGPTTARRLDARPPTLPRLRVAVATGLAAIVACAIPLRGITDVAPVLEQLASTEQRSAALYAAAVDRFRAGKISVDGLTQLIEQTIVPDLTASTARIDHLGGVPWSDQPRVTEARRYLSLRLESRHVLADGLRDTTRSGPRSQRIQSDESEDRARAEEHHRLSAQTFGRAESLERESLTALDRVRP